MKSFLRYVVLLVALTLLPVASHAQVDLLPVGGLDQMMFPSPEDPLMCSCTPVPVILTCANPFPTPPAFTFYLFVPLFLGSMVPTGGFLAEPIGSPVLFPVPHILLEQEWVMGFVAPLTPVCGLYINMMENAAECGIAPMIPLGFCIPIPWPVGGVIQPLTGAVPAFGD